LGTSLTYIDPNTYVILEIWVTASDIPPTSDYNLLSSTLSDATTTMQLLCFQRVQVSSADIGSAVISSLPGAVVLLAFAIRFASRVENNVEKNPGKQVGHEI